MTNNTSLFSYSSLNAQELFKELSSSSQGLPAHEAKKRLLEWGANVISQKKERSFVVEFFSHFLNPLILILLFASTLSFFMGEITDAIIIFCIILFSVLLDFFQEYSADKALKKLVESVRTTATVIRNGRKKEVQVTELVEGDLIFLSSGDLIPADARVLQTEYFFVNQSAITGESYPCEKTVEPIANPVSIPEMNNIIFRGTNVVSGSATAIILKTGKNTEFGRIASKLGQAPPKSEFELGINKFGLFLMKIILMLVIFIFFINSFLKHNFFQSFMFAIAIAVGVTPELLPMIMSVTMTFGSKQMSKKGVIVKKLSSIPNFGGMNVLCTDKTGTLTENKIALVKYTNFKGDNDERVLRLAFVNSSFQTGIKNPLDEAVIIFKKVDISDCEKVEEIPYDFSRKKMSVVFKSQGKNTLVTKGAPEEVFKGCTHFRDAGKPQIISEAILKSAEAFYFDLSKEGFRVLAVASKEVQTQETYTKGDEVGMVLEGFVSFLDPPKKDVREAISALEEMGVEVKVITGDNELVTKKICSEVGLTVKGVLFGSDMDKLTDDALRIAVQKTTIFARCSPDEKNRIITALRASNNVVGYMGDGINDAPSLKTSDVGISVDSAVDVAKESADIVLTKKSLGVLKDGIIEGRKTFANTMKYVMMALSSNFGNMFSAAGAVLFLPFLPMLPIQILFNNLIYDFSQVTIPTDKVDDSWVKTPKRWNLDFVKKFMYTFGPISSIFDFITFFFLFVVVKASAPVFQTGWFMESLATQTLVIHVIRTKELPLVRSRASYPLIISSIACLALGWIIPYTALGKIFKFEPMPLHIMLVLVGIVLTYLLTVEIAKRFFFKANDF